MKNKALRIIGILAAMALMIFFLRFLSLIIKLQQDNRISTAKLILQDLDTALDAYLLDVGQYPETQNGLRVLIERPAGNVKWNGPYLRKNLIPKDPWGNDFIYQRTEKGFELYTLGADGKKGGTGEAGDIVVKETPP